MARQVTLVAFAGAKPGPLATLIDELDGRLSAALGPAWRPYAGDQVHATLIGLECVPGSLRLNRNFSTARGRSVAMDVPGLVRHVAHELRMPLSIRFGGFAADECPFTSRGRSPSERSFSIQPARAAGGRAIAVLMGWPVRRSPVSAVPWMYPRSLDALRRDAQDHGVLHAWHARPADVDNDLYLRLGLLADDVDAERVARVETEIRGWLAKRPPVIVDLLADALSLIGYIDETLPLSTSRRVPVTAALSDAEIDALYA